LGVGASILFSLALSLFVSAASALLAILFSPMAARNTMRLVLLAILLLAGLPIALVVAGLFGQPSEIVATFAWVLAFSFVATGCLLIAAAPAEASEQE